MGQKETILKEIDELPTELLGEVIDFIKFLKSKSAKGKMGITIASEASLSKDWLRPEEEVAWENL